MFDRINYILTNTTFDAPAWVKALAVTMAVVAFSLVVWSYLRGAATRRLRLVAAALKTAGIIVLAVCLMEPHLHENKPRPGANLFLVVADSSQSLQVRDSGQKQSRGEGLKAELTAESAWQTRLGQDFELRRYVFDARLRPVADFSAVSFDGHSSSLATSLNTLARRYKGRPQAGLLLLTDGNATDFIDDEIAWDELPPVYPVVLGDDDAGRDLSVARVAVSQTNFEASPVTITSEIVGQGYAGQPVVAQLLDENDQSVDRQTIAEFVDGRPQVVRFQLRPEKSSISFYSARVFAESEERQFEKPATSREATLVNNSRLAMVDRGQGPYRVLYVTGRPNWEYKFLRRALEEDDEVDLVALVRIANKEPKFTFRGRAGERTNPLFRGFGETGEETEQYDQPVTIRLGTEDADELRDGFPKSADQLFRYHAIILDDIEAGFFTRDQMTLIHNFVSQRGGGCLMLGGQESFAGGDYRRTPIGELLPIYLEQVQAAENADGYRLELTREGWLQPWVRLRATELDEEKRLVDMPAFKTLNLVETIKPGASVLARVQAGDGAAYPGLVVQRFGNGRSGALLVGDLWLWNMRRKDAASSDLEKAWRQTVRWLVADVPQRVEVESQQKKDEPAAPVRLEIRLFTEEFKPLDNASVRVQVTTPDAGRVEITAEPSDQQAGVYVTDFVPRAPGAYRATVIAQADDGSPVGQRETGWTSEPATDEFRTLTPNRELLQRIAEKTDGRVVNLHELDAFARTLSGDKVPIVEARVSPLWHDWRIMLLAVSLLAGEWGLRRWKGLP